VVTAVGDLAVAVKHGETGLVSPPHDSAALAAALAQLLSDPRECDRQGAAAKALLHRASGWSIVAEQVLGAYHPAKS
jgi:glycosyltransferase involved in cell wall biosynthesis